MGVARTLAVAAALAALTVPALAVDVVVTPAAPGLQIVRVSVPLRDGLLRRGSHLAATTAGKPVPCAQRELTWHPSRTGRPRYARRALVTFPYRFGAAPVRFSFRQGVAQAIWAPLPVLVTLDREGASISYADGRSFRADALWPAADPSCAVRMEEVERNGACAWQRLHIEDKTWPRVIEARSDAVGQVTLVAHLQSTEPGFGRAPDLGWRLEGDASRAALRSGGNEEPLTGPVERGCADGKAAALTLDGAYRVEHPMQPLNRRGKLEASLDAGRFRYRYLRCTGSDRVPMQERAWRRADMVISPASVAPLQPSLLPAHGIRVDWREWDALYGSGPPADLAKQPKLADLARMQRDALVSSAAEGDDAGNVTGWNEGRPHGPAFGMNRLNHAAAMLDEARRSGDRRLTETALRWCGNFHDLSVWWGPEQRGGTRYNNVAAMGQTPPPSEPSFMWRSNSSVTFCTKGFAAFFEAFEATGDPRMLEALQAQVAYAVEFLHAGAETTRNVGCVQDFLRLHRFTGETRFLEEALRLFRELRACLSTGDLFTEGGRPIKADPPFIEEDSQGYLHPFAKPYIIGYALEGLPELMRLRPGEPKLRDTVEAVAGFLAQSQDPCGGWRYPHPRSSGVILSQAMEHAWQLVQAERALGSAPDRLDAVERVLRQRVHGSLLRKSILSGVTGWERVTGKATTAAEITALYRRPADRDAARDYREGRLDVGSSPPEGLAGFGDVLRWYLAHRPASRLLAPPRPDEPLGLLLR